MNSGDCSDALRDSVMGTINCTIYTVINQAELNQEFMKWWRVRVFALAKHSESVKLDRKIYDALDNVNLDDSDSVTFFWVQMRIIQSKRILVA